MLLNFIHLCHARIEQWDQDHSAILREWWRGSGQSLITTMLDSRLGKYFACTYMKKWDEALLKAIVTPLFYNRLLCRDWEWSRTEGICKLCKQYPQQDQNRAQTSSEAEWVPRYVGEAGKWLYTRLVRKLLRHLHFILNTLTWTNKIRHE